MMTHQYLFWVCLFQVSRDPLTQLLTCPFSSIFGVRASFHIDNIAASEAADAADEADEAGEAGEAVCSMRSAC